MTIILIRHAHSQQDTTLPANEWRLSGKGRESCKALAERLSAHGLTRLVSSMEPKAIETAQLTARGLGVSAEIAFGLHEHDRSNVGFVPAQERLESMIRDLFAKPDECVFGTESGAQAGARFAAAIAQLEAQYPGETLGVVTHGTVLSLFVGMHYEVDTFAFWQRLEMPDVVVLGDGFKLID